jgi:hypothetical protein
MGKRKSLAKPPPGEFERVLLGKFESESNPGTWYEVRLGHDNVLYCTCKAWCVLRNGAAERTCPHVRNVQAAMNRLRPGDIPQRREGLVVEKLVRQIQLEDDDDE